MAVTTKGLSAHSSVQLSYQLLRNTTSPDELLTGVKSYVVNLPVAEILKLGTEANLRGYVPKYDPHKRTRVHREIRGTIEEQPERFITRNSGFVVTASEIEINDGNKTVRLKDASILNGAQSQGEIRRWVEESFGDDLPAGNDETPFFVRAEIIVDADSAQVVETAVARNRATPVGSVPIAAARRQLEDLMASVTAVIPNAKFLIKDVSPDEPDAYDPRKIVQYARLLMPISVSQNDSATEKLRAYKNPEQCLADFTTWHGDKSDDTARRKYEFIVSIAPDAIKEFERWETHDAWVGHNIWETTSKGRACRRDKKTNEILWVSPGLLFPIMGAMSEFAQEVKPNQWAIVKPRLFKDTEMIKQAVAQFRALDSDPMQMGRSAGAYDALRIYPRTLIEVMRGIEEDAAG